VIAPAPATVVIAEPTFGELRAAAEACGHTVIAVRGRAEDGYACDLAQVAACVARTRAAFAYLCNPSTPIGQAMPAVALAELAAAAPGCQFVLDESFLSLSERFAELDIAMPPNVIRVRSLTKDHALPGVRIGYALGPIELVRRTERMRPSWTVSALAQRVAELALEQTDFLARSRERIAIDRAALSDGLRALGFAPMPSCAPYVAVPVGDAARLRARLLSQHQVLVRDCASFGLPDMIRIAVRPEPERARLFSALRAMRDGG
jgi:histidinol-phosphate/aromatic aminotransferase/cobyric acid decarboxylase-like protein